MDIVRTTVDIPDTMYRRLKARAAKEGRSAKALILPAVEQVLITERSSSGRACGCRWCARSVQTPFGWTMPASTTSFLFPDMNVWVALTHAATRPSRDRTRRSMVR
jgi:plasmid stability protein